MTSNKLNIPNLSDPKLRLAIEKYGMLKSLPAESTIINDGDFINSIPLVLSGSIRVMRLDEDGREILLYYIKPGESCIMSFLSGFHRDTSKIHAVIEEDAEILIIPIQYAGEWLREFPDWLDYVLKLYHKRFEDLLTIVNQIAFQKVDERLLDLLKKKSQLNQSKELHITHQQIANELGTAREVVSRLLKQLERDEKVNLSRNKIILHF